MLGQLTGWQSVCKWQKLEHCDFLGQYKYKCKTFGVGSTPGALPIPTTFSDLDCISRSQCQTVLNEDFMFLPD